MASENELRALLAEARVALLDGVGTAYDMKAIDTAYEVAKRIDAALAEPVVVDVDSRYSDEQVASICVENTEVKGRLREAQRERDEARAEVARLRWGNEMACENTPTKGCECPGCGLARERAERGEDGP